MRNQNKKGDIGTRIVFQNRQSARCLGLSGRMHGRNDIIENSQYYDKDIIFCGHSMFVIGDPTSYLIPTSFCGSSAMNDD